MSTYDDKRKAALALYEETLAQIDRAEALSGFLPREPLRIHFFKPTPWITYEANTLKEAADILRGFHLVEAVNVRDGCILYRTPLELHTAERRALVTPLTEKWHVELRQNIGHGFRAFEVSAYAKLDLCDAEHPDGTFVRVAIKVLLDWKRQVSVTFPIHHDGERHAKVENVPALGQTRITKFYGGGDAIDYRYEYAKPEAFFLFADHTIPNVA